MMRRAGLARDRRTRPGTRGCYKTSSMAKQPITILITDLDDTLYDWLRMWHAGFSAMLPMLVEETGLAAEQLESEFKRLYQQHGTSEYWFALEYLPSLLEKYPGVDLGQKFDAVMHAFHKARKANLVLFPTVRETLIEIKRRGCLTVGYTESPAFYVIRRLRQLEMDGLLDYLYSSPDHELPPGAEEMRRYPPSEYELQRTIARQTPKGTTKPNAGVLLRIIRDLHGDIATTAYIGDKLPKDVGMAQDAGVIDIYAAYGAPPPDDPRYDQLRRVSHWPAEAIAREKTADDIKPTYVARKFGDLMTFVEPKQFVEPFKLENGKSDAVFDKAIEAWKTSVSVQEHFNDLVLRIRNFGLTIVLASLGAVGWCVKEDVPLGGWALTAGLLGWAVCWLMDRHWYHLFLKGAVGHAMYVEDRMREVLPELSLTRAISNSSKTSLLGPSTKRVDIFYFVVGAALLIFAIALICIGGLRKTTSVPVTGPTATGASAPVTLGVPAATVPAATAPTPSTLAPPPTKAPAAVASPAAPSASP
jgi:FMN phosphatase YigB (HAD superfamily)